MQCRIITKRVLHWIQNNRSARILNLFSDVCNLVDDGGELISLAARVIGPGPFTMVMDSDFHQELSIIDLNQPVVMSWAGQSLSIGPLAISFGSASVWNAVPNWSYLRRDPGANWPAFKTLPPAIQDQLSNLLSALGADDYTAVSTSARALAGLGNGATPAGDDVIMGIVFALWIWRPQKQLIDLIIENTAPHTTTLSAAFLYAAAAGEATVHWHDLARGDSTAPGRILAVGDSSGADAWSGFLQARDYLTSSGSGSLP